MSRSQSRGCIIRMKRHGSKHYLDNIGKAVLGVLAMQDIK